MAATIKKLPALSKPIVDSLQIARADDAAKLVDLTVTAAENILAEGSHATNFYKIARAPTNAYSVYQAGSSQVSDGAGKGLSVGVTGTNAYIWMRGTGPGDTTTVLNIGAGGTGGLTIDADNDIVALEGTFQLKAEQAAPSAPASGEGGIFYVKDDGIPYFISNSTAETSLVGGGGSLTLSAVSAATVAGAADTYYIVDSSSNAVTITLPVAATAGTGARVAVKARNGATNAVTVASNGSELIDDSTASVVLSSDLQRAQFTCDGTGWWVD